MSIEVRFGARAGLDEVVARDVCAVHLERLTDSCYCLIVETRHEQVIVNIGAARAAVLGQLVARDFINRRANAQRKRWQALTPDQRKRRKKTT